MARHQFEGKEWWCLPGGSQDPGETPEEAVIRELQEECNVNGTVIHRICTVHEKSSGQTITFLVDIADQVPTLGFDPEFDPDEQALVEIKWLSLDEISERDRAFLWASGLLTVDDFGDVVSGWGDDISYPGK